MIKGIIILSVLLVLLVTLPPKPVFADNGLVETEHALIWGYGDAEIPEYLTENFDRMFKKIAKSLEIDIQKIQNDKKILVWVVDFKTLQKLYYHQENPGLRKNIAALYDKKLNRLYFTPPYVKEYYITWGIVNYFIDEYPVSLDEDPEALARRLILEDLAAGRL